MKNRYKAICIVLLSLVVVLTGISYLAFTSNIAKIPAINSQEKVTIQSVSFNSSDNSVSVTAIATHLQGEYTAVVLQQVLIKNATTGDIVADFKLVPVVDLKINELTTVNAYLNESVAFVDLGQAKYLSTSLPTGTYAA